MAIQSTNTDGTDHSEHSPDDHPVDSELVDEFRMRVLDGESATEIGESQPFPKDIVMGYIRGDLRAPGTVVPPAEYDKSTRCWKPVLGSEREYLYSDDEVEEVRRRVAAGERMREVVSDVSDYSGVQQKLLGLYAQYDFPVEGGDPDLPPVYNPNGYEWKFCAEDGVNRCEYCGNVFASKRAVNGHKASCPEYPEPNSEPTPELETDTDQHTCIYCGATFETITGWRIHAKSCGPAETDETEPTEPEPDLDLESDTDSDTDSDTAPAPESTELVGIFLGVEEPDPLAGVYHEIDENDRAVCTPDERALPTRLDSARDYGLEECRLCTATAIDDILEWITTRIELEETEQKLIEYALRVWERRSDEEDSDREPTTLVDTDHLEEVAETDQQPESTSQEREYILRTIKAFQKTSDSARIEDVRQDALTKMSEAAFEHGFQKLKDFAEIYEPEKGETVRYNGSGIPRFSN